MSSILADIESHFEPVTREALIAFGFREIKWSNRLLYERTIRLTTPYKAPTKSRYVVANIPTNCVIQAFYKPNIPGSKTKDVITIHIKIYSLSSGTGFKPIKLVEASMAEVIAAFDPVNLEKNFLYIDCINFNNMKDKDFNCFNCWFYGVCNGGSGNEEYCEMQMTKE